MMRQALALVWLLATAAAWGQASLEVSWDDLIDPKWAKEVQVEMMALGRLGGLKDGSEAADRAMAKLRQKWDAAPIVSTHIGKRIRIPGYVVPLDADRSASRAFLLVPYFGACIHTPPPPANQIILVVPQKGAKIREVPESMATVWVEGVLEDARTQTSQGVTGYQILATEVRPYEEAPRGR